MTRELFEQAELWNVVETHEVASGRKPPLQVNAKVDNGSTDVVVPEEIAEQLDLIRAPFKRSVRLADGRRAEKEVALGLCLRLPRLERDCWEGIALIEPGRDTVLLGCEFLEHMELDADHKAGCLKPRPGTENGQVAVIE